LLDQVCHLDITGADSGDSLANAKKFLNLSLGFFKQRGLAAATAGTDAKSVGVGAGMFFVARPAKQALEMVVNDVFLDWTIFWRRDHAKQVDVLTKAAKLHPEGVILYYRAVFLFA